MDSVIQAHSQLISGLTEIYTLLENMAYISPTDVVYPPHTADAINSSLFHDLGYDPETISLMKVLPAMRNEVVWGWQKEGAELLPRSKLVNYFLGPQNESYDYLDWVDYLRWGDWVMGPGPDGHRLLPPWMLKLTVGGMYNGQYGVNLVYDLKNKTIIEWSEIGNKLWDESPSQPAETVLANIVSNFKSLAWIPYVSSDGSTTPRIREIKEDPISENNQYSWTIQLPTDHVAALREIGKGDERLVTIWRGQLNHWRAYQKLYRDCGWGTSDYDVDEFRRRREEWWTEERDLERQIGMCGTEPRTLEDLRRMLEDRRQEVRTRKERFWSEKAGTSAV